MTPIKEARKFLADKDCVWSQPELRRIITRLLEDAEHGQAADWTDLERVNAAAERIDANSDTQGLVVNDERAGSTVIPVLISAEVARLSAELAALRPVVEAAREIRDREHWCTVEMCKEYGLETGPGNRLASALAALEKESRNG